MAGKDVEICELTPCIFHYELKHDKLVANQRQRTGDKLNLVPGFIKPLKCGMLLPTLPELIDSPGEERINYRLLKAALLKLNTVAVHKL